MNSWTTQAKVGLVVIIGLLLLCVLLVKATDWPLASRGDFLSVRFGTVNDLRRGAGVYLAGVQIGKVTGIELKAAENEVEIRMRVKGAFERLRQGCKVRIGIIGFVGEAYIDFVNGPIGNPPLRLADLPLIGEDPVGIHDFLQQSNQVIAEVTQLIKSANKLMHSNQETITHGITDVHDLVVQTSQALERVSRKTEKTLVTVDRMVSENNEIFQQALGQLTQLLQRLEQDSLVISERAEAITGSVLDLISQASPSVDQIMVDLRVGSSDFRRISQQLRRDLALANTELSELIVQSQDIIQTKSPKVDLVLDNLAGSTAHLNRLQTNLTQLIHTVQHGDGSIPQLLNAPDAIDEVRETLQTANETMKEIQSFSGKMSDGFGQFSGVDLSWDYELRYVNLEDRLHNELALLLLPSPHQRYRFGVSLRDEHVEFEGQYGYEALDGHLRGRLGFMRSRAGVGLDIWLLSQRLGITAEGIQLTSRKPKFSAELTWKFFRYGHVIIGAENLTDDICYTAGIRMAGRNW